MSLSPECTFSTIWKGHWAAYALTTDMPSVRAPAPSCNLTETSRLIQSGNHIISQKISIAWSITVNQGSKTWNQKGAANIVFDLMGDNN